MKILCLGDSNTWGFDPRSCFGDRYPRPWPELLEEQLSCEAVNLGENGAEIPHSEGMMTLRLRQIEKHMPADLLIMMLGTNDVMQNSIEPETVASERMDVWLTRLRSSTPELPILLMAPPEVFGHRLGAVYQMLAEKHGTAFVDCNDWQMPLAFDGVHLTEESHKQLANQLTWIISRMDHDSQQD